MSTIKERLAVLETEIKALKKLLYITITIMLGQTGVNLIPIVEAALW